MKGEDKWEERLIRMEPTNFEVKNDPKLESQYKGNMLKRILRKHFIIIIQLQAQGYPNAQERLGRIYLVKEYQWIMRKLYIIINQHLMVQLDMSKGRTVLLNTMQAIINIHGRGVEKDISLAIKLFSLSADG